MRFLVSYMKRLALYLFPILGVSSLMGQAPSSGQITISTQPAVARFYVDGQLYIGSASFIWPAGSKHILQFVTDTLPSGQSTVFQTSLDGTTQFGFGGWKDNSGFLTPSTDPVQTITADPRVTSITTTLAVLYKVSLNYFNSDDLSAPPSCGSPGAIPAGQFRPGLVYLGASCFWSSTTFYAPAGALTINAIPYPGFVFMGWSVNLGQPNAYIRSVNINGPLSITPQFSPAKRVTFLTSPLGLQVLVDRTTAPTRRMAPSVGPCPENETLPPAPPAGVLPLCYGDFDFAPGSTHVISGASPQLDQVGKWWVFDSWSNGGGQNAVYNAGFNVSTPDTLTANFVPGAQVAFVTNPAGLKLNVDGRQNWPAYNFVWGLGTTHDVSPVMEQFDSRGRKYAFREWSNGGAVKQTITVDQSTADSGYRIVASYNLLSRVIIQSSPAGLSLKIDGQNCQSPCSIDRPNGSQLQISAPVSIPSGDGARLDFTGWSDGAPSDHAITISGDTTTVLASYTPAFRLAAGSDPADGVQFQFSPSSSDGFYPVNTSVSVTAAANPGFKFRRWAGDLSGTYPAGGLVMSSPRSVMAMLDRIPYIPPAGVKNAAGDTPSGAVAPGSVISIFGQNLAPKLQVGRVNPLAQTIVGVTVTVGDRILPLFFVSPQQINAQVPSDLPDGDYTLVAHSDGQPDVSGSFTVARNAPGLFAQTVNSQLYVVALHEDGTVITPDSPARNGEVISVLGTGFGAFTSRIIDGFLPPEPPPGLTDPVEVSVGDLKPDVIWSGAAPGYTGCAITKFRITNDMPSASTVELQVRVNGQGSNTVMLPIQ